MSFTIGLSPLARGTRGGRAGAQAGIAVYPRWRGEHVAAGQELRLVLRFIPAGAGNTSTVRAWPSSTSVYPRWRGEHSIDLIVTDPPYGLSPLARGTPR